MKMMLKLCVTAAALTLGAGAAQAQDHLIGSSESRDKHGVDAVQKSNEIQQDQAISNSQKPTRRSRGNRTVAAAPEDVTAGAEVRDAKGAVVGSVESVSLASAVVTTAAGKVEVPLGSFGKNSKGLAIAISKAEFDQLVAQANAAPAN